jgi:hypothetical protein
LQESLLRQIARLFGVVRQPAEQGVHVRGALGHEPVEGRGLARAESVKELIFGRARARLAVGRRCRGLRVQLPREGDWLDETQERPPAAMVGPLVCRAGPR